jgi:aspartyl-tRNA(Asn)/glutamyl-tRNA(Gln) amidotransferase subunit C
VKITLNEVRRIADLANLEFSDQECEELASQLSDVLDYIETLKELDTAGVSPTSHLQESGEAFREDEVRPSLSEAEALANAPERGGGLFKVPKVIG